MELSFKVVSSTVAGVVALAGIGWSAAHLFNGKADKTEVKEMVHQTEVQVSEAIQDVRVETYDQQIESYYDKIDEIEVREKEQRAYSTDEQKKKDIQRRLERTTQKQEKLLK